MTNHSLKLCECGHEADHDGTLCEACYQDAMSEFYERDAVFTDADADAEALASAGMGTDEDYWCFESDDDYPF